MVDQVLGGNVTISLNGDEQTNDGNPIEEKK